MKDNFLGNNLLLTLKRQDFVIFFGFLKTAVWIRNRNLNRSKNRSKVGRLGTGTNSATNHYGSATRQVSSLEFSNSTTPFTGGLDRFRIHKFVKFVSPFHK